MSKIYLLLTYRELYLLWYFHIDMSVCNRTIMAVITYNNKNINIDGKIIITIMAGTNDL